MNSFSLRQSIALWLVTSLVAVTALALGSELWFSNRAPLGSPYDGPAVQVGGEVGAATVAGDWRLPALSGEVLGPADLSGPVVVELWATWCGPCKAQTRELERLREATAGSARILAVNQGESEATVRAFTAKTPLAYPVLLDPQSQLLGRFAAKGLPTVVVLDAMGEVVFQRTGVTDADTLQAELEKAAAGTGGDAV